MGGGADLAGLKKHLEEGTADRTWPLKTSTEEMSSGTDHGIDERRTRATMPP
jgi:hypothetical protein